MGYLFTRQQLYELVWAGPITTLAKSLAVSDVGLAKACRRSVFRYRRVATGRS
ncbi:hypothetical protein [Burkholderia sp. FL-7-2-10-S1-D7]|uniref:hypothetical protein n=1 Tax=Burkholderia sp. FL-7-2-10-S1-D7 TaxID=1637866 RepID=UPI0015D0C0B9|nr:hypothetical protein [Burkholderia sp. FL-7-2-10-S1-D7]